MKPQTRRKKEESIIAAAEKVFSTVGLRNARMEDIAAEAEITKVTLYSYFQSKDNLIFAITHKALSLLEKDYEQSLKSLDKASGLDETLAIMECFIHFCETNYFYSEILLEYFALVRSTSFLKEQNKMTNASMESEYLEKLSTIHNNPFKITANSIIKGQKDGSIDGHIDPMMATINGWIVMIGYVKLLAASGGNAAPIFNVKLEDIRSLNKKLLKAILQGKIAYD